MPPSFPFWEGFCMVEQILARAAEVLGSCPSVEGVVLGGSRATGTAGEGSDVDIGVYYRGEPDLAALNRAAAQLDDAHREGLICPVGGWGEWVNCGGWLVVEGVPVDLILRDLDRVAQVVERTERGQVAAHYQTGHPHAYVDGIYRGELACCRVLYARTGGFLALKRRAERYPDALREALGQFFCFESGFSCMFAEKSAAQGDLYYTAGHLFRAVSALNQVLFALNRQWCLNEKKAVARAGGFPLCPAGYQERVNRAFALLGSDPAAAAQQVRALCQEVGALWERRDTQGG